jgi:hypothetical protein
MRAARAGVFPADLPAEDVQALIVAASGSNGESAAAAASGPPASAFVSNGVLHATPKTAKRPRLRTIKDWYLAWAAMRGAMLVHLTALAIQAQFDPSKLAPFKPLPPTILDQIDAYETTIVS